MPVMAKGRGVDLGGCYLEAKDDSRLPFRCLSSLNSGGRTSKVVQIHEPSDCYFIATLVKRLAVQDSRSSIDCGPAPLLDLLLIKHP
jgi:hypothetical protein